MEVEVTNLPDLVDYTAQLNQMIDMCHIGLILVAVVAGLVLCLIVVNELANR